MEKLNVVNDTRQAVVEPAGCKCENGGAASGTPDIGTKTESADRPQSAALNSGFRKLRLENEALKAKLSELSGLADVKRRSDIYLNKLVGDSMSRDLEAIRAVDPGVQSLHSLGDGFIRLIENGVDALTAYHAVTKASEGRKTPTPPPTGRIGTAGSRTPEFYSSRELDRLTARDLENPEIFRKAMESLKRL